MKTSAYMLSPHEVRTSTLDKLRELHTKAVRLNEQIDKKNLFGLRGQASIEVGLEVLIKHETERVEELIDGLLGECARKALQPGGEWHKAFGYPLTKRIRAFLDRTAGSLIPRELLSDEYVVVGGRSGDLLVVVGAGVIEGEADPIVFNHEGDRVETDDVIEWVRDQLRAGVTA